MVFVPDKETFLTPVPMPSLTPKPKGDVPEKTYEPINIFVKSWTQAYIGNHKIEQMKLKCCIQIDNTFIFEDKEGK